MTRRPRGLLLTLVLFLLVVFPLAIVLRESVWGAEGLTLEYVRSFAREPQEWAALWASLWISVASVILASVVGVPLAFIFERLDFPGRRVLGALVALPAVLPPLVGVIAFLFLYGESGFVPRSLMLLFGLDESPWRLQGPGAILLVHAYSMYVYFYLFTRAGLAKLDKSMLEASHALGSDTFATFRRVTLPLLRPQLAAAALLTFMTSLGSFSAPYIFGGGFRVMTTQIVVTKLEGYFEMAIVETAALAAVAVVGLFVLTRTAGARSVIAVGKGTPPAARALAQPLARWGAAALGWAFSVVLLLPHITLIVMSLVPLGTWTTQLIPPAYTWGNYGALLAEPERLRPLFNSVWMATAATLATLGLALWAGRLVVQRRATLRAGIETLLSVPWAVPGTVLAIALAATFNWLGQWIIVSAVIILPLAYLVRNIPIAAGSVLAGFRQLDPALDEAAASLGASRLHTLRAITVPLLRPALLAGGALAFVTALGDFVTSILLYTFDTRPVSMEILAALRDYDVGIAAAYGVVLMLFSAVAMAVGTRR